MREADLMASYGMRPTDIPDDERLRVETPFQRFLGLLDRRDGHWLWRGPVTRSGQTRFDSGGRRTSAKRFSYEAANETVVLAAHEVVTVTCGEQSCVFPGHLELARREELLARGAHEMTPREAEFRARREAALSTGIPR